MNFRLTLIASARSTSRLAERFDDDRPLDPGGWREVERPGSPSASTTTGRSTPGAGARSN
ncbi:histidine phosphatase family protein, partial [Streptomyces sp. MCAF7]